MTIEILAAAALALTTHSPSLPKPLIAPELRATDCAVPDERAFLLGQGEAAVAAVQPLMESSGRMEARMTAHAERLIARGV